MNLGEKLQLLRALEGNLRGFNRPLRKSEVVALISTEIGETISQAYLSQLESGKRPHMTETTREILSRFYKVHPGFFVSDPEGYRMLLTSFQVHEDRLDEWVLAGVDQFRQDDPELAAALQILADHSATRSLFLLLAEFAQNPRALPGIRKAIRSQSNETVPAPTSGTGSFSPVSSKTRKPTKEPKQPSRRSKKQ